MNPLSRLPTSIAWLTAISLIACAGSMKTVTKSASEVETTALDEVLPVDSLVVAGRLDNGFRYLIRVNEKPENRAELRLVVNFGSVLETEQELHNLLELLMMMMNSFNIEVLLQKI